MVVTYLSLATAEMTDWTSGGAMLQRVQGQLNFKVFSPLLSNF